MKTPAALLLAIVVAVVALASTASAVAPSKTTSAYNAANSRRKFGLKRSHRRTKPTFVVEPLDAVASADGVDEASPSVSSPVEPYPRILPASARAAGIACVSAAAIGGARHALEMICS